MYCYGTEPQAVRECWDEATMSWVGLDAIRQDRYLSRLSNLQKEVLRLISIGFMQNEILEELHINQKMYEDCYNAIHSYRNVSLLF